MLAGNIPALPDNARSESSHNSEIDARGASASMLLAQADIVSACLPGLTLTAICADVRCACNASQRFGSERKGECHAPQICWNYFGEWRRASGRQIKCDSWS